MNDFAGEIVSPVPPHNGLDRLAARIDAPVIVCEGEKSADAAAEIFPDRVCVTSPGGSKAALKADWTPLAGRKVLVWPDCDEPGSKYAVDVASVLHMLQFDSVIDNVALAGTVSDGSQREPVTGWDAADAIKDWPDLEALRKAAVGLARPFEPETLAAVSEADAEINRLAGLGIIDFERARKDVAKKLGIRATVWDKVVGDKRAGLDDSSYGSGRPLTFKEPEPWPYRVDGAVLLSEIADEISKYVVLAKTDADAVALWCVHTHCFEAFLITPRLAITSPVKRCGKTTVMDILKPLVWRGLKTSSISSAAVYRTVEVAKPTLIIDEADAVFGQNGQPGQHEDLRAVLNSGYRKGDDVLRVEGDKHEVRMYATFSPCAIALIGKLPDTLADRSVSIPLKRRLPSEAISRFRADRVDDLKTLARKASGWAADNAAELGRADPDMPGGLFNRDADNWRPLFAIAEVAGADWPVRVRNAALAKSVAKRTDSLRAQILADISSVFEAAGNPAGMRSADLVAALVAMEERPWGEINRGKPITQNGLARKLKPFEIWTCDVHVGHGRERQGFMGYSLKSIKDACARYIPGLSFTPLRKSNTINDLDQNQSAPRVDGGVRQTTPGVGGVDQTTSGADGSVDENYHNSLKHNGYRGGMDETGLEGGEHNIGQGGEEWGLD